MTGVDVAFAPLPAAAPQGEEAAWSALLDDDDRSRAARAGRPERRREILASRALLRQTLARHVNAPPPAFRFAADAHGKPHLVAPTAAAGALRFNLSHAPGMIACAVAAARCTELVGIDVEEIRASARLDALAARFFHPAERAALAAAACDRARLFFTLWTLKEAYAKARGFGLAVPFERVAFEPCRDGTARVHFAAGFPDSPAGWRFETRLVGPGHVLSVATRDKSPADYGTAA